jgi:uncharacterized membrane protein YczE
MKHFLQRMPRLFLGLFLYALGIYVTIRANIGYAPWDVFHTGLSKVTGMTLGTSSIVVGVVIGLFAVLLGEKIGLGTIANMVVVGVFIDLLMAWNPIQMNQNFWFGIPMIILGLYIIAFATYFYIGTGFGAGPRDSLMVALTRKTKLPVGLCRGTIEVITLLCGWYLGGSVGLGTVISALGSGFCVQTTFKLMNFNITSVKHETLTDTWRLIRQ